MKLNSAFAALFLATFLFTGCDKKENTPAPAPNPTTQPTASPGMTAKVNGTDWTAAIPVANLQDGDFTLMGATMNGKAIGMYAVGAKITQPGTYATTAVYSEVAPGSSTGPTWGAPVGTVTISKLDLTAKKVSGTFSFVAEATLGTGATGNKTITSGTFTDITLQ